jgi:N-acetylglucosaminyl-diphospho-decaprenol L-rhamnosyltransferase
VDQSDRRTVTAVVVTWNGAHLLPPCLDSLRGQTLGDRLRVVVVDNASTDGTLALLASRYPEVTVVRAAVNLGFAGGVDLGIRSTGGDAIALLNNDATFAPDAVEHLLAQLDDPRVGAVTARILLAGRYAVRRRAGSDALPPGAFARGDEVLVPVPDDAPDGLEIVNSTGNVVTARGTGQDRDWLRTAGSEDGGRDVFGFCGGAALLRRSAVEAVGGFDPELFLYYEDTDLSWRLRAAGWAVRYAPEAGARHRHAASSDAGSPLFRYHNSRNALTVFTRHAPSRVVVVAALRQAAGLVRAVGRSGLRAPDTGARARALRDWARRLPRTLAERRRTGAHARVPRREIAARYLH